MKKRTKVFICCAAFAVAFLVSAVVRIAMLGSAPERLIRVEWNDSVGTVYKDLPYENDNGNKYDLYVPAGLQSVEDQYLILFIHVQVLCVERIHHCNRRLHFADTRTGCFHLSYESGN